MFKDPSLQLWLALTIIAALLSPAVAAPTYITEFLVPFDLPADDLKVAVQKQLSHDDFLTNHFTTDHVAVSKLVYKATYNGIGRIVDPPYESFKHTITGDSIDVVVTYHAIVHPKLPTKKNINGTTSVKIYLNYSKQIDFGSESTLIKGVKMFVDPASFHMSYTGNPSASERKLLDYINNGSLAEKTNTTIYYLLQNEEFSSEITLKYFLENLVNQKLSPTYDTTYNYQFESLTATFDLATAKLENIPQGVAHSMRGSIKNYNSAAQTYNSVAGKQYLAGGAESQVAEAKERGVKRKEGWIGGVRDGEFHTQFTLGFISNFLSFNMAQNERWRKVYVDRSRFNSSSFRFRVLDLQFMVNDISKYAQYYLNDIDFTCNPVAVAGLGNTESPTHFYVALQWSCKCKLSAVAPAATILDFDMTANHLVRASINGEALGVYIISSKLKAWEFREVDGIAVVDEQLAVLHLNAYLKGVVGWTVGSNFKVKAGSKQVVFDEESGLWIG